MSFKNNMTKIQKFKSQEIQTIYKVKKQMNFLKNLIGGQIVKGYTVSGDPITGVGHHKSWKLYKAKKDSTGIQVSMFVLQKKSIKSTRKQQILKSAKKQAASLAKIRHPGVLALVEPMIQDQNVIAFVTQKVQGNISTLIKQKRFEQFVSSELQLKLNLFPLLEAINFLHQIVKLCHLGINLQSVYITVEGKWKIAGFNYSQQLTGEQFQTIEHPDFYDYLHLPPEVVKQYKFNKFADSYSLGVMFINFMLLIKKTPNNMMLPTQSKDAYTTNSKAYRQFGQFPSILQSTAPQELIQLLTQLFVDESLYRLSISSLQSSRWINDPIVLTVKYLQKISNYQNKQQLQFLKGLAGVIDKFSGKILHKRIIPTLTNLFKFSHLIASIIFIIIDLMKKSMITVQQWRRIVWPELKVITQGKQMTAQALYLLISNMEVLQKFILEEQFMSCIIPLYLKCFDCPPKLKVLALKHVQRLTKKYDYQFTKTKIVPKLVNILKDQKIEIRKDTLKVLFTIIGRLDPHTIVNVVLVGLQNCRKAGADSFINAITVEIYNKITTNMSAQVLATKIIPGVMPYLIDPSIERDEFGMYKNALINMMNKIEEERKKTWGQNQNNVIVSTQKYSERDFILEKLENQNVTVTQGGNSQNKFQFLNEYKNSQQIRPQQIQPISSLPQNQQNNFNGLPQHLPVYQTPLTTQGSQIKTDSFSFGFEVPVQQSHQSQFQKQQHKDGQITITQHSNYDAFSFDMGFGNEKPNSQFNKINVPKVTQSSNISSGYQSPKVQSVKRDQFKFQPPKVQQNKKDQFKFQPIKIEPIKHVQTNQFKFQAPKPTQTKKTIIKPNLFLSNQNSFQQQWSMKSSQQNTNENDTFQNFLTSTSEYQPPSFDFETSQINNLPNKQEKRQLPFSPSTQPQIGQSKPVIKGLVESQSKKLVGPSQGGLKKPPKYNQFNMHLKQQTTSSYNVSQNVKPNINPINHMKDPVPSNNFTNNTLPSSNKVSYPSNQINKQDLYSPSIVKPSKNLSQQFGSFSSGIENNDDPFAEVQQQYGIPNNSQGISNTGFGIQNNDKNSNLNTKPPSNDPFDDLL